MQLDFHLNAFEVHFIALCINERQSKFIKWPEHCFALVRTRALRFSICVFPGFCFILLFKPFFLKMQTGS